LVIWNQDPGKNKKKVGPQLVEGAPKKHFGKYRLHDLVSANRTFPITARVDLQSTMERLLPERSGSKTVWRLSTVVGRSLALPLYLLKRLDSAAR
jgi:hypothetical protein